MNHLGKTVPYHFVTWLLLAVVCSGQDLGACEVIPKNLTVKFGSSVTVMFKAPSQGICRERIKAFSLSNVFWTLNSKKIEESYYDHNSTYATVTISNFSRESGTVECHMYEQVLGGTIVRTHATSRNTQTVIQPPKKPTNISCVIDFRCFFDHNMTCYWDNTGSSLDTTYKVTVTDSVSSKCKEPRVQKNDFQKHYFQCVKYPGPAIYRKITVTVTAENSAGTVSATVEFDPWEVSKFRPPKDISVNPLPTSLSVSWSKPDCDDNKCEVQCVEDGTNVRIVSNITSNKINVDDVKPCTNYTIAVRCKCSSTLWTDWSTETTVRSRLNASSVPIHLWRRVLKQHENGTRLVQLMWKGPSASCEAVDKYWLFVDSRNLTGLEPTQNHTSVSLSATAHEIRISAYKSNTALRHSFLKIPVTGKDKPRVLSPLATAVDGVLYVSWDAPSMPVNDYVIEWFKDGTQEDSPSWVKTQEMNISIPDLHPYKLYTVTITPLYGDEPGEGRSLHAYSKEGAPAKVTHVNCMADDTSGMVSWKLVRPDQCCGNVVNYTVFYHKHTSNKQGDTLLNETVNRTSHKVTLWELQPSMMYKTYVRTYSALSFSDSDVCQFQTKAYGKALIQKLISGACGVALLLVLAVFIFTLWKKLMNRKVPDPQFSSMATWSAEKSVPSFSNNLDVDNSKDILLCQIDTEMDARLAPPADKDSPQSPSGDWPSDSGVALDTSASSGTAENTGLTVCYKLSEAESENPESNTAQQHQQQQHQHHQQPSRASPSPSNPYLNQMPVCGGCRSPSGEQQGPGPLKDSKPGVGVSQQRASTTSSPGTTSLPVTTYVSVDMLDGQREG